MSVASNTTDEGQLAVAFQNLSNTDLPSVDTLLGIDMTIGHLPTPETTSRTLQAFQIRLRETDHTLRNLQKEHAELQQGWAGLDLVASEAEARNETLQQELSQARTDNTRLGAQLEHAQALQCRALPYSDKFRGGHKDWARFHTEMKGVFAFDADFFPTEQHKLMYLFSRLEGAARDSMSVYWTENGIALKSIDQAYDKLAALFVDPAYKHIAAQKVRDMQQCNREYIDYWSEFICEIHDTDFNETMKLYYLINGLSDRMIDALRSRVGWRGLSFDELHDLLLDVDSNLRIYDSITSANQRRDARDADFEAADTTSLDGGKLVNTSGEHVGTAALSLVNGRLTSEERQRRMAERLCLYCAGEGHQARTCPRRPANKNSAA
ncbi:hypothetical protein CB0940_10873 [Cercospora beticola]|uniref:CCHC-type domain-containing protein n=1 Tax=Cercospora beticola TaxID=122368 RepID=A0A2G5HDI3_CERBT|nr:hypothetical protein CB0940_10873 [Cercospora beticola]PIA90626.1 hypothetical protein CB0940_10873 [Cercospora beticola]